mmetsp:Transcript_25548/g.71454  ORF Transcript_25548/g.71454 Transcript_25548/m.71454 type:complete len:139 (+) Transcript_25548:464-880(+)|eukprot:CAMPEP_0117656596 /NCGR_PEP_ID=MMETSP0804-20121206/4888_1 /TAXON_ID=1074897 /ORGANISM="Tetraselmis astigmatica, Strain CCMP880" /LENGTH=138 /DNA_ID=CAMNT_0005463007 /DNA_START=462 /DNA_END=878 /DNA_ORIENTATION=+
MIPDIEPTDINNSKSFLESEMAAPQDSVFMEFLSQVSEGMFFSPASSSDGHPAEASNSSFISAPAVSGSGCRRGSDTSSDNSSAYIYQPLSATSYLTGSGCPCPTLSQPGTNSSSEASSGLINFVTLTESPNKRQRTS